MISPSNPVRGRGRAGVLMPGVLVLCLVVPFLTGVLSGCSRNASLSPSPENLVIYPPPPAPTRIQYLTHISGSADMVRQKGRFHQYLFGKEEPRMLVKPYGIAVHGNRIYICDTGQGGLVVMDLARGSYDTWIPGGRGQLQLPVNCCTDESGNLFVADANRRQVVIFDRDRNFLDAIGDGEGFKPTDVLVRNDTLYVVSVQEHRIHLYSARNYEKLGMLEGGDQGSEGFVRQPTNLAMGDHLLYVSDFGDFNVKKISTTGRFGGRIGSYGNGPGQFTRPKGLDLDKEGNLYVVDAAFQNVQIFNPDGQLLMHFGGSYNGPGAMWLPAGIAVSYENLDYFRPYVDEHFELKHLIFVTNQYGPAKVNVYGFVEEKETGS